MLPTRVTPRAVRLSQALVLTNVDVAVCAEVIEEARRRDERKRRRSWSAKAQ
jgi:hypothetical protein